MIGDSARIVGRVPGHKFFVGTFYPPPTSNQKNVRPEDPRLIARSLQGDQVAFGELVARYQDRLFNTVYRLVGNPEDAADVVQEAFLSAYQSLANFKGDAQF